MRVDARGLPAAFTLAAFALLGLPTAGAAVPVGPRLGLSMDPDQVNVGIGTHAATLGRHFAFQPSFDLGVGDEVIALAANMDFKYVFAQGPGRWSPYLGGGPGLFHLNAAVGDHSDTDVGLNFFGGMQMPTRSGNFYGELRAGLMNNPDVKFTVGWMFYR